MNTTITNNTNDPHATAVGLHPFEASGMGRGPYRFVGVAHIPGPSLAEANPDAYNAALRALPRDLVGGCGTCSNCGMAIMNIYIVADADGKRYGVGCDCVEKTGDACLSKPVLIAKAKLERDARRAKADARRLANHNKWLADVCPTGETNAARLVRENWEKDMRAAAAYEAGQARLATFADIVQALPTDNDFFRSLIGQLAQGNLSDRQAECIANEIHGRRAAYSPPWEATVARLTGRGQ